MNPNKQKPLTAEEVLSKHTGEVGIYRTKGMVRASDALKAMHEFASLQLSEAKREIEYYKLNFEEFQRRNQQLQSELEEVKKELESCKKHL